MKNSDADVKKTAQKFVSWKGNANFAPHLSGNADG